MAPAATARAMTGKAVKVAASFADLVRRPADGVVVLLYHRVGAGTGGSVDQPPALFDAQMAELRDRVVSIDDALALLRGDDGHGDGRRDRSSLPPVVVTFDDGTADFVDVALPILVRHGVPATLYVATQFVDDQVRHPDGAAPVSWSALAEACNTGLVTIGSHTHAHRLLDRVDGATAAAELDRSLARLGDELGVDAQHFAYPKALVGSPDAEKEVRARFRSAAVAGTAPNPYGHTDVYRLARSPVQVTDGMRWFRRKAAGGMAFEDRLRRVVSRRRYAGSTT